MSPQRLYECSTRIAAGSMAWLSHFVDAHILLVYSIAREYLMAPYSLQDLMRAGNIGLLCALEVVSSPRSSIAFYTAVGSHVRGAIQRFVAESHRVEKLPYLYVGHHISPFGGIAVLAVHSSKPKNCELRIGDLICTVDREQVAGVGDINRLLSELRRGDLFAMRYLRNGVSIDTFLNCE